MSLWFVLSFYFVLELRKIAYARDRLDDTLLQANLAAALMDLYEYGSSGDLRFQDVFESHDLFLEILNSLEIVSYELYFYEEKEDGFTQYLFRDGQWIHNIDLVGKEQFVGGHTRISNASIYAKASIEVFIFGETGILLERDHCVDVTSLE